MLTICIATLLSDPLRASEADLGAAIDAALAAGYGGASVWAHQLAAVGARGMPITVVEAATAWANGTPEASASEARRLAEAAHRHGAGKILAACLDAHLEDEGRARANLAVLADEADTAGAQVCLEFLPWSGVPDLAAAWALVEPLGPAAGLLLDTWHWTRQRTTQAWDVLASVPGERIGCLQLCDAAPRPGDDLLAEAMTCRLLPGEGVGRFADLLALLAEIGARPVIATEVFHPARVARDGAAAYARATHDAAERVLAGTVFGAPG